MHGHIGLALPVGTFRRAPCADLAWGSRGAGPTEQSGAGEQVRERASRYGSAKPLAPAAASWRPRGPWVLYTADAPPLPGEPAGPWPGGGWAAGALIRHSQKPSAKGPREFMCVSWCAGVPKPQGAHRDCQPRTLMLGCARLLYSRARVTG